MATRMLTAATPIGMATITRTRAAVIPIPTTGEVSSEVRASGPLPELTLRGFRYIPSALDKQTMSRRRARD
jgi:hypothetical protein